MIRVTLKQRDNLLSALNDMWPSVPEANVAKRLGFFRAARKNVNANYAEPPTCGTVACFGGWCAWWPPFREQGVGPDEFDGSPRNLNWGWSSDTSQELFGHPKMFATRGFFHDAQGDPILETQGTDHEVVTKRLQWLLANSEVV